MLSLFGGKSTLINLLLEQDILPSSPVPTTSNTAIVSVADKQEIIANLENQQYTKLKHMTKSKNESFKCRCRVC